MLKRDMIIMTMAVGSGLVAFVLIANFLNKSATPKQTFVVAARNIPAGQIIAEEDLTMSQPMQSKVSNDLFTQAQDALGNQAVDQISSGSLVYRSKVNRAYTQTQTDAGPQSLPIPPGMRAMTIAAGEFDGMPERLGVGAYLDILGMAPNYEGVKELQTIIRAAQILSLEKTADSQMRSITIAVSPLGAIVITKAMENGKLHLVVRPDGGKLGVAQGSVGFTEIIRGVEKEKSTKFTGTRPDAQ